MKKLMITLGMFATFCTTEAKVTLPALFTDNMMLQQKSDITLRGHSTNRKEVMVITGWDKHIYMAQTDKQGNWKTEISTPSAGGPYAASCTISTPAHTSQSFKPSSQYPSRNPAATPQRS